MHCVRAHGIIHIDQPGYSDALLQQLKDSPS